LLSLVRSHKKRDWRGAGVTVQLCRIRAVAEWLATGAPGSEAGGRLLPLLCEKLVAAGLSLARVDLCVKTLHPDVAGVTVVWYPNQDPQSDVFLFPPRRQENGEARGIAWMRDTSGELRIRTADPSSEFDPADRAAPAITDHVALPLIFSDGAAHAAIWSTARPSGFAASELHALRSLMPLLARVIEIVALRRAAATLLETYVGSRAGPRILAGHIGRGHTEDMKAAIWLSDMRNFTALSDALPARIVVEVLNRYFDCQVPAIRAHGGEVLKFMGDGLLAVFPIFDNECDASGACQRALIAARASRAAIHALRCEHEGGTLEGFRFGVALHFGELLYGNIGGSSQPASETSLKGAQVLDPIVWEPSRLDFTCIGPAINLAARLERISSQLGRSILASQEFARSISLDWIDLGEFAVRGLARPERVFGLAED
jgi:adenylate cyclase